MKNWFLKKNSNVYSLQKLETFTNKEELINKLKIEIEKVDASLSNATSELIRAQTIGIKIALSRNNNWIDQLQKKAYWSNIQNSASWHREKILHLYQERRTLQIKLDKLTGKYWSKQILNLLKLIGLGVTIIFALWLTMMGIMATIFLLPLFALILLGYFIVLNKNKRI